jgi:DNA-binding transcriptional regulator YhcF (GntR family)
LAESKKEPTIASLASELQVTKNTVRRVLSRLGNLFYLKTVASVATSDVSESDKEKILNSAMSRIRALLPPLTLNGLQQAELVNALNNTFKTYLDLSSFLLFHFDVRLDGAVRRDLPLHQQVFQVVSDFNQGGLMPQLMTALIAESPDIYQQLSFNWGLFGDRAINNEVGE